MVSDPTEREGPADPAGSDPGTPEGGVEPTAGMVSRAAWIGGLAVGVLVCAIGFGTLSMFAVSKLVHVVLEMVTVGVALLMTTRIWQKSAAAGTTSEDEAR